MSDAKREFERLKGEVEAADDALVDALERRAQAVKAVAALRQQEPDSYFRLPHESDVIGRLAQRARLFEPPALKAVLTEVLSACQKMTAPIEVVYVGQEGGFGHLAARTQFGSSATHTAADSSDDVLTEVEREHASFGILPFETSYDGAVTETLNILARSELKICAEIPVKRTFHMISTSGKAENVKRIFASSSALTACASFLAKRFPQAVVMDVRNGIIAADRAKQEPDAAALGTEVAAQLSGLQYVETSIEDAQDLYTRYVAVGNDFPPRTGSDRTAVAVALHDAVGVLLDCLKPFADRHINLYRLETRPARGWEWRYLVLFEVDGHITDRPVMAAVEDLRGMSHYVRVLGSYPKITDAT